MRVSKEQEPEEVEGEVDRILDAVEFGGATGFPEDLKSLFTREYAKFTRLARTQGWEWKHHRLNAWGYAVLKAEFFKRYLGNRIVAIGRNMNIANLFGRNSPLGEISFMLHKSNREDYERLQAAISAHEDFIIDTYADKQGVDPNQLAPWKRRIVLHANMLHFRALDEDGGYRWPTQIPEQCAECIEIAQMRP